MKKTLLFLSLAFVLSCSYGQGLYSVTTNIKYDSLFALDDRYFAAKQDSLWGVVEGNTIVCPFKFEAIDAYADGMMSFTKEDKIGFADIKGNILIQARYLAETSYQRADKSPLNLFSNGSALVYDGNRFSLIDKQGNSLTEDNTEILSKTDNVVIYRKDGAYGMMDGRGNSLSENKYMQIQTVIEGKLYAYIGIKDGMKLWGLSDSKGNVIARPSYDDIRLVNKGDRFYIKAFLPNGKQALYDEEGNLVFQPLYQVVEPSLYPSYFTITQDGKKGIIGSDYVLYVPTVYEQVQIATLDKDTFFVGVNDGVSFVLKDNKVLAQYEGNISGFVSFSPDNVVFVADSFLTYGVYSSRDSWLIRPDYVEALGFVGENIILRKGKKWGSVNLKGEIVVPFDYEKVKVSPKYKYVVFYDGKKNSVLINDLSQQQSFEKTNKLFAFNDYIEYSHKGNTNKIYAYKEKLSTKFQSIGAEKDGILSVKDKQGWTYVDVKTQEYLTDKHFDEVSFFDNGKALVIKDDKLLVIDDKFETIDTVLSAKKTFLSSLMIKLNAANLNNKPYLITRLNNKYGVITINKK